MQREAIGRVRSQQKKLAIYTECENTIDPAFLVLQGNTARNYCGDLLQSFSDDKLPEKSRHLSGWTFHECMHETAPALRLSNEAGRMAERDEMDHAKNLTSRWCARIATPWTPDASKSAAENKAAWQANLKSCLASHQAADMLREREAMEKTCAEKPETQSGDRRYDTLLCLQQQEPLRRMSRELTDKKS